jgi:hypothetical protein
MVIAGGGVGRCMMGVDGLHKGVGTHGFGCWERNGRNEGDGV